MSLRLLPIALSATILLMSATPAMAQQEVGSPPAAPLLPSVPTTRILAIGTVTQPRDNARLRAILPEEVRETVDAYLKGKIDQWYVKQDGTGVVFILNFASEDQARQMLDTLPFAKQGLMHFDLVPLGPLNPLGVLLR